jgi:hypothetical protein
MNLKIKNIYDNTEFNIQINKDTQNDFLYQYISDNFKIKEHNIILHTKNILLKNNTELIVDNIKEYEILYLSFNMITGENNQDKEEIHTIKNLINIVKEKKQTVKNLQKINRNKRREILNIRRNEKNIFNDMENEENLILKNKMNTILNNIKK